uniref:2-succinylbenzoyl-CoA synthetase n=1 Tax=Candidatus Kentrum sp. LPFa TaxID=2126335 RepID=A0A450X0C7_9GAMM|nr:MAG: 2-succinylbenzoyl-CoA synthetase [Candidatus Kentron sp. LPFa]VFK22693.1 MAG: 2-succinylbenzoyl-CoA synthetase [Candidatus Kentron sp. LPFa]
MTDLFHWTDRKTLVRPFLLSPDGDFTYGDLSRLVGRWRGFIRSRQYAKPTRVALAMADPLHTIAATLALWCEGHIVCPLHLHWSGEARAHLMETLGTNVCIAEPPEPDSMNEVVEPPEIGLSQHALAMLLYTSGSCAAPKGCCLTLAALLGNASASLRNMPLGIGDVWLLSLPLFHVGGWGLVLRTLLSGSALALPARNAPIPAGVTHVSCVPTQLARWFEQGVDLSGLEAVLVGGAPIPRILVERATHRDIPLFTTYGCTEMASQVSTTRPNERDDFESLSTAGHVLEGHQVHIAETREIFLRGPCLALGYWQNGAIIDFRDAQGWYRSGDFGYFDEAGRLCILGRKNNLIISGGENIQPERVEGVILESGLVSRCVVVGRDHPTWGQRPIAFCEWLEGGDEQELATYLSAYLPRYKAPDAFLPWPSVPKSQGLKIDRKEFQHLANHSLNRALESENRKNLTRQSRNQGFSSPTLPSFP